MWEWLETIIELPHGFVDRHGVFLSQVTEELTWHYTSRKKRSWSLSFPSLYLAHSHAS